MQTEPAGQQRAAGDARRTTSAPCSARGESLRLQIRPAMFSPHAAEPDGQTLPVSGELQVFGGSDDGLHPAGSLQPHVPPGGVTCPTGTTLIAASGMCLLFFCNQTIGELMTN